ncbi:MAG TPA: ATP-dependent RecD-like DNA helicase [Verrucomicrobia bacterium]|nr:MAG: recombinase RecD [Lentisphaerae bacterium GWF2_57_35]HBA86135.1 ATP-dependent RecD-like DNA helicase [Verrucomicrobiota bacterium]
MASGTSNRGNEALETLEGLVERVTFHSDESGFCVLKVKARGHRELVSVVGTLPSVNAGEWLKASGRWMIDKTHGRQFKAEHIEVMPPDSIEGIEKYLGSGLIKGIGPHYAARLVKSFGKEIFDVIETRSALLLRVEGIGEVRKTRIKASWNEQKSVRAIMTFLMSYGVSTSKAFRIYKMYGEQAIEKVRLDPYCLARDIHGIGFKTADQIAERLGIAKDSDLRARAGVSFVLQELADQGHCAFPQEQLTERTAAMLEIDPPILSRAIQFELSEGRLTQSVVEGQTLIYLASLDSAEKEVAARLVRLAKGAHPCTITDFDAAENWVEQQLKIQLAPAQKEAFRASLQAKLMVITGGPGVGKTTLVKAIIRVLCAKKLKVVLCAPTGRAAKRLSEVTGLSASTIHRMLAFEPGKGTFRFHQGNTLSGDVFIIDETSMIDIVLACQLLRAIPPRAAVVLVGDVDQLPSVGPGCVLRDIIDSDVVPVNRLNQVFRQAAESAIVTNAHRINEGEMPVFPMPGDKTETDCYFIEAEEPEAAGQKIIKLVRDSLPSKFRFNPVRDIQVLTPMQKGDLGARNLNQLLQQALNPKGPFVERYGWIFRAGDRVMQMENDYDKDVFNGDIGFVEEIDEMEREMTVRYDERAVVYDFQELDEVSLSYAITIHKSQGSEYPCVIIPVHTQHYIMLQRNLIYTALTRGRRMVVLVGTRKALALAVRHVEASRRVTTLKERLTEIARREESRQPLPFDS